MCVLQNCCIRKNQRHFDNTQQEVILLFFMSRFSTTDVLQFVQQIRTYETLCTAKCCIRKNQSYLGTNRRLSYNSLLMCLGMSLHHWNLHSNCFLSSVLQSSLHKEKSKLFWVHAAGYTSVYVRKKCTPGLSSDPCFSWPFPLEN